jgi:sugar O-acyltransferase (sialic acid O-acetyltransferase NeuD family)
MKRILILGAGGFGREVLAWARTTFDCAEFGFLDDNPLAAQDRRLRAPVVATLQAYQPRPDDLFLCAVGNPAYRRAMSQTIQQRGGRFGTLVHPTAIVAEGAELGEGAIICPFVLVSADARVEQGAAVYYHSSVDHDAVIGAWSQVSAHCDITGGAVLGPAVFMGSHASVLPRVKVGEGAVIGAGAIVTRDVPAGVKMIGIPARVRE